MSRESRSPNTSGGPKIPDILSVRRDAWRKKNSKLETHWEKGYNPRADLSYAVKLTCGSPFFEPARPALQESLPDQPFIILKHTNKTYSAKQMAVKPKIRK